MRYSRTILSLIVVAAVAAPALGDWNFLDPYKYRQPVDTYVDPQNPLRPRASAVDATQDIVADDFPCVSTGPITSVHIAAAWSLNGTVEPASFNGLWVGFHDDVPAQDPVPSRPGMELWRHLVPKQYIQSRFVTGQIGWWFDRFSDPHWKPVNLSGWQYNVDLDSFCKESGLELFEQQGTATANRVYWLSIQADMGLAPPQDTFGWVTSGVFWNDDASYIGPTGYTGQASDQWTDMVYAGDGHLFFDRSVNMAFVLVPEPATMSLLALGGLVLIRRKRRR